MTLSVKVSVNGNYRTTVKVNNDEPVEISGVGSDYPVEQQFFLTHGQENTIVIAPEEYVEPNEDEDDEDESDD